MSMAALPTLFICNLSGRFTPEDYPDSPVIQLCQMKCEYWIVADGNSRIGLILRSNSEARLADIPKDLMTISLLGESDNELMAWWNPCPKSFKEVMIKQPKKPPNPKGSIYGIIERSDVGRFTACTYSVKAIASGRTAMKIKKNFEKKLKAILKRKKLSLVLMPMAPLEEHQCVSNL
jgi:hypothetical protein